MKLNASCLLYWGIEVLTSEGRRKVWRWQDVISWLFLAVPVAGLETHHAARQNQEQNQMTLKVDDSNDVKHNATDIS
jgi:hypothetical protein